MVVRPDEVLKKLHDDEKVALEKYEKRIDEGLSNAARRSDKPIYTVNLSEEFTRRVAEQLAAKYRAVGWSAQIHSDQRDGDYLEIKYREKDVYLDARDCCASYAFDR